MKIKQTVSKYPTQTVAYDMISFANVLHTMFTTDACLKFESVIDIDINDE